jgi:hypothetical protein
MLNDILKFILVALLILLFYRIFKSFYGDLKNKKTAWVLAFSTIIYVIICVPICLVINRDPPPLHEFLVHHYLLFFWALGPGGVLMWGIDGTTLSWLLVELGILLVLICWAILTKGLERIILIIAAVVLWMFFGWLAVGVNG